MDGMGGWLAGWLNVMRNLPNRGLFTACAHNMPDGYSGASTRVDTNTFQAETEAENLRLKNRIATLENENKILRNEEQEKLGEHKHGK